MTNLNQRFNTRSQKLANQARTILMKGWFSDLEILEICEQLNNVYSLKHKILKSKKPLTQRQSRILITERS